MNNLPFVVLSLLFSLSLYAFLRDQGFFEPKKKGKYLFVESKKNVSPHSTETQ